MEVEEVKRLIRKRIALLRRKLELYETLLKLLEECGSTLSSMLLEEVRDEDGRIVAKIYRSGNKLRMVLEQPVPPDNPYIRFLLRKTKRMQEEGVSLNINLEQDEEGRVLAIEVGNDISSEELVETMLKLLRFIALRVARST